MAETALWRRIDVPGHDAARIAGTADGWELTGMAVFAHEGRAACLGYAVVVDRTWATLRGRIRGFLGDREVDRTIERGVDGWRLDGVEQPGLGHLADLDLGFTPATNLLQIQRVGLQVGEAAAVPAAWLDAESQALGELPQTYRRIERLRYAYESPTAHYRAVLDLAENGFVRHYPGLWRMEA